jgi:hypothetical protein
MLLLFLAIMGIILTMFLEHMRFRVELDEGMVVSCELIWAACAT